MPCGSRRRAAFQEYLQCFRPPPERPEPGSVVSTGVRARCECPPCPPEPARTNAIGSPPCRGNERVTSYEGAPRGGGNGASGVANWRRAAARNAFRDASSLCRSRRKCPTRAFMSGGSVSHPSHRSRCGRDEAAWLLERDRLASCIFREEALASAHAACTAISPSARPSLIAFSSPPGPPIHELSRARYAVPRVRSSHQVPCTPTADDQAARCRAGPAVLFPRNASASRSGEAHAFASTRHSRPRSARRSCRSQATSHACGAELACVITGKLAFQ